MLLLPWAWLFGMANNYSVIARRVEVLPELLEQATDIPQNKKGLTFQTSVLLF